uniref:WIYLD domain-containing protein n=1 Tax=Nelumbo nucifera TaxID=4432 RepID=A0A822Y6M2_NELNU|nr:TPA_asm: hypothetical protein HUJ06_028143 [Nelumbo nucifera]
MPPRRRNKKVGLKRMDAAVDALFQMGFSKSLVRNTVKNLLKVYGGDDGWPFIEEGSYKLVLDTILEEQEKQWVVVQKDESLKDAEAELVSIEPQCVMQVGIGDDFSPLVVSFVQHLTAPWGYLPYMYVRFMGRCSQCVTGCPVVIVCVDYKLVKWNIR